MAGTSPAMTSFAVEPDRGTLPMLRLPNISAET